jgi:hypothetical protein
MLVGFVAGKTHASNPYAVVFTQRMIWLVVGGPWSFSPKKRQVWEVHRDLVKMYS